jgi:hypothetical protein
VRFTVAGVNVPPPPPSLGVIVAVPPSVPPEGVRVTVKFEEAFPAMPPAGPVIE